MIWFTELGSSDIIFQFLDRECPEDVEFGSDAILNKIKYPGGHQTNQIIGVYRNEIEWTGLFFGTFFDFAGKAYSAKARADKLESLVGRPLRVGFPVGGDEKAGIPGNANLPDKLKDSDFPGGGFKGVYVVESVKCRTKNYLNIEYTIRLVPHDRQDKIRPTETSNVRAKVVVANLTNAINTIKNAKGGPKGVKGTAKSAAGNGAVAEKIGPKQAPSFANSRAATRTR